MGLATDWGEPIAPVMSEALLVRAGRAFILLTFQVNTIALNEPLSNA
jgi:hypothetical protein